MMKKLLFVIVIFLPLAAGNVRICADYADGRPGNCMDYPNDFIQPILPNPTDQLNPVDQSIYVDQVVVPLSSIELFDLIDLNLNDSWNMLFNNSSINNLNLSSNNRSMSTT
jgi:hypothetical protein